MVKKPKRILIVRTDRIGDVILSAPAIQNLKGHFPDAHVAFMCRPYTKQILEGNPYLDEIITYDKYGRHKDVWSSIKFIFYLRRKKFDWAVILHPTNRVHLITFFSGIPFRAGWKRKMGFLLTRGVFHDKQEGKKHELEYTLDILKEINIPIVTKSTYFSVTKAAEENIHKLLSQCRVKEDDKVIVIHPSASCRSKRWPQEYFLELVKLLKEKINARIVVITAKGEEEFGQRIVEDKDVIDLRGKLDIREVGALLKRTTLFISNDSGPVHIAWSLKVPVISLFGRKNPGLSPLRWQPLGENSFYIHKDAGCRKCLAHLCKKDFLCLRKISPQEVYLLAQQILSAVDLKFHSS